MGPIHNTVSRLLKHNAIQLFEILIELFNTNMWFKYYRLGRKNTLVKITIQAMIFAVENFVTWFY
jgi:hypothetical protein